MRVKYRRTNTFHRRFNELPVHIQEKAKKAFMLFKNDPRHPSLQTKKMRGKENTWEGRIDQSYRFIFHYDSDEATGETFCIFDEIGPHRILDDI